MWIRKLDNTLINMHDLSMIRIKEDKIVGLIGFEEIPIYETYDGSKDLARFIESLIDHYKNGDRVFDIDDYLNSLDGLY